MTQYSRDELRLRLLKWDREELTGLSLFRVEYQNNFELHRWSAFEKNNSEQMPAWIENVLEEGTSYILRAYFRGRLVLSEDCYEFTTSNTFFESSYHITPPRKFCGKAWYGPGGALVSDTLVEGVSHLLSTEDLRKGYTGDYFIGESMSKRAAQLFAKTLNLEWVD